MKRLLFALLFVCSNAFAGITDLKLSTAQIFDVQWNISGGKLNTSGFNYIYSSINYATQTTSAARWTAAQTADAGSNGRYIGFFHSTTHPGTYGMAVYNSDGTVYKLINNTGSFRTLADGAIFYNGNGMWGTLITTKQGYTYGQSASFTITQEYPTNAQLEAYIPESTTPLAAGETATASPPPLCCGASAAPFSASSTNINKVDAFVNRGSQDSQVYIEQIGNMNTVVVQQTGTRNNYTEYNGNGSFNTVNITQSGNASTTANYTELNINGNTNTANITQQSTGGTKGVFVTVNNSNNSLTILQKDAGSHYAEVILNGGNKTVDITQQGSAGHMARVELSGNPIGLTLTQSGSTQQHYSINYNCTTAGGCGAVTVQQGQ
jgi:hypothetical protein